MSWHNSFPFVARLVCPAVLVVSLIASAQQPAAPKTDLDLLQGEWSMLAGTANGQDMPEAMLATAKRVCKGDETTVMIGGQLMMKAKFTLDPSKKPKTIDYQVLDGFTKGKTQLGIYEISGNTIKFCFGSPDAERPSEFSSKEGDGRTFSTWKRKESTSPSAPEPSEPGAGKKPAGAIAPDIKPEALWDGRKRAPFRALDSPRMVRASEADFLDENDYVLGVAAHGESRAYPTRFIWWHHVINDQLGQPDAGGEIPIAVTYCSVCNTGIRYDRRLEGRPRQLDFYGLYNGVVALCDRDTGSAFLQVDGRFVTGPLLGATLKTGPLLDTTWREWKKLHPETLVMSPDTNFAKFYSPREKPEPRGYNHFPAPFFRPSMTRTDNRLPFFEKVLGVAAQSSTDGPMLRRAYPLHALQDSGGIVNDSLGAAAVVVFLEPDSMTASAFSRELEGRSLTFQSRKGPEGKPAIFDQQTSSRWDIEGRAQAGPLMGKSLVPLQNHISQWYGWVAYFPETSIYGRSDPPQFVDLTQPGTMPTVAPPATVRVQSTK